MGASLIEVRTLDAVEDANIALACLCITVLSNPVGGCEWQPVVVLVLVHVVKSDLETFFSRSTLQSRRYFRLVLVKSGQVVVQVLLSCVHNYCNTCF